MLELLLYSRDAVVDGAIARLDNCAGDNAPLSSSSDGRPFVLTMLDNRDPEGYTLDVVDLELIAFTRMNYVFTQGGKKPGYSSVSRYRDFRDVDRYELSSHHLINLWSPEKLGSFGLPYNCGLVRRLVED